MAPQSGSIEGKSNKKCTEDIVISGMSGVFPASDDIDELEYNLYNKIYMPNDDESRYQHTNPKVPHYTGKIKDISSFDADWFDIPKTLADHMDPQNRLTLEEAIKAVFDAGVNPKTLMGSKTGVYVGCSFMETEDLTEGKIENKLYGISGSRKGVIASRVSYYLDLKGPSLCVDTACSSSLSALDLAMSAIRNGEIDAAIVGGANLTLHVNATLQFATLGVLSKDGMCRPFDVAANGYVRSETISCIFLQKKSVAKRIYATVLGCRTNCDGFKVEGITFPSSVMQEKLLRELYSEAKIDLNEMGLIEAHSTATVVGDPEECRAIDNAIARHRKAPLKVGSVKSNCGHAEPAAGMNSIVKVLLSMNNGIIPPNINFTKVRPTIESLREGRMVVVSEPTVLDKPIVGINSFGFGGANAHTVLKQYHKIKTLGKLYEKPDNRLPRLVIWSARTEQSVERFLNDLEKRPLDFEYLALTHSAQEGGVKKFNARGYSLLLPKDENTPPAVVDRRIVTPKKLNKKIIWILNGIGGRWPNFGSELMQLPLFEKSIQKCHTVLEPLGLSLRQIISVKDIKSLKDIVQTFVGITALQIALVDVLKTVDIEDHLLIGLSIGEIACAYADGCLTAEEAILVSYYCGKIAMEKSKGIGAMALVKVSHKRISSMCPKNVSIAGILSQFHCLISGPKTEITSFIGTLKASSINAEELKDINIALHGKQMSSAIPDLINQLKKVISKPKARSRKWISSSVPKSEWSDKSNLHASAEYFANNLQNCVLLEQMLQFIPKDALVIEFGPQILPFSIEKNANGDHVVLMPIAMDKSPLNEFLKTLGSIYNSGVNIAVDRLYPKVQFPVSRGTRVLSPLVQLDHTKKYYTYSCDKSVAGSGVRIFCVVSDQQPWIMGHEIDGRVLLPATFYLEVVWRTLAGAVHYESFGVEFENVSFQRATVFPPGARIDLMVIIHYGSGRFEIAENESLVVTGYIKALRKEQVRPINPHHPHEDVTSICKRDFYKELKLRGYHYSGDFQGVENTLSDGSQGQITWIGNWTTFMDCMLQMSILAQDSRTLCLPTKIRRVRICPKYHLSVATGPVIDVYSNSLHKRVVGGGIEIIGLDASEVARRRVPADPVLEKYQFVQHFPAPKLPLIDICRCCIQIYLENQPRQQLQVIELAKDESTDLKFLELLGEGVSDLPLITGHLCVVYEKSKDSNTEEDEPKNVDAINRLYADDDISALTPHIAVIQGDYLAEALNSKIMAKLESKNFIIVKERGNLKMDNIDVPAEFELAAVFPHDNETFLLLRKVDAPKQSDVTILNITDGNSNFGWIEKLQEICKQNHDNVVLVAQGDHLSGIIGLTNCLRKEPETKDVRCVFIDDPKCPAFDLKLPLFSNQLKKTLGINVYRQGAWGTYRHLKVIEEYPVAPYKDHAYAHISQVGDLHSLQWYKGPIEIETKEAIKVVYASLNFRDVMQASGRLPMSTFGKGRLDNTCIFGFEYSGYNMKTGKRVMGMKVKGAFASHFNMKKVFEFDVPENWSLREAATVPVVYLTVYYAFFFTADIRKGKSILIHSGCGGVGLAAIRVAQAYGLEVFTTVGSKEKREYLLKNFPKLKDSHIGNSRDTSFEQMIMNQTGGIGVDFVLNSLSEEKLATGIRCLAPHGHFLEIGKYDMSADSPMELSPFLQRIAFSSVLADLLLEPTHADLVDGLKNHMLEDIKKNIVCPLPVTVYKANEIEPAFRFLMSGKHIGKVVVQVREDEHADETFPISVTPQVFFKSHEVFVVPGGLGGFGLELVDWMIIRGARKIVLSSSRGITNDYQKLRILLWRSYGCDIVVNTADIGTIDGCLELLTVALKLGPVGGIFNLAVLLKDAVFQNQNVELFQQSFKPKAFATIHLDQLSRRLCPEIKHFVIFSSVSCGRGNAGQTNYGMANSIMERIVEDRVANGLPGKAVQWGAVGEVGLVAEMAAGKIDLEIGGTLQQRISSCLEVLDVLLSIPDAIVSSMVVAEKKASAIGQSPLDFVLNTLVIRDIKSISMTAKLSEIGLDSLTSVEIRQTFERDYGIVMNTSDIRSLTLEKLVELSENVKTGSGGGGAAATAADAANAADQAELVEHLRQFYGQLPTLMDVKETLQPLNSGKQGTPIIVLPGVDGCGGKVWEDIGRQLNRPAVLLKYQKAVDAMTLQEVHQFCTKLAIEYLQKQKSKQFQIIGYSMGGLISHQVIASLESEGFQGRAIYIDGSPEFIKSSRNIIQAVYKDEAIEKKIVSMSLSLIIPSLDLQSLLSDLSLKTYAEEIYDYMREKLNLHSYPKTEEMMATIKGVVQRVKMIDNDSDFTNIETTDAESLLIKPTETAMSDLDEHYGLNLVTRGKLNTDILEGNHVTLLNHPRLPEIINKFFDKQ